MQFSPRPGRMQSPLTETTLRYRKALRHFRRWSRPIDGFRPNCPRNRPRWFARAAPMRIFRPFTTCICRRCRARRIRGGSAADVFENGTRDPQLIPMDLPAGPDYVVGPGDGLAIDLWGGVSQRLYRTVDREGRVSLPEVGPMLVSGKSLADVQQNLQQILRTQFRDVSRRRFAGAPADDPRLRGGRRRQPRRLRHQLAFDAAERTVCGGRTDGARVAANREALSRQSTGRESGHVRPAAARSEDATWSGWRMATRCWCLRSGRR